MTRHVLRLARALANIRRVTTIEKKTHEAATPWEEYQRLMSKRLFPKLAFFTLFVFSPRDTEQTTRKRVSNRLDMSIN